MVDVLGGSGSGSVYRRVQNLFLGHKCFLVCLLGIFLTFDCDGVLYICDDKETRWYDKRRSYACA